MEDGRKYKQHKLNKMDIYAQYLNYPAMNLIDKRKYKRLYELETSRESKKNVKEKRNFLTKEDRIS